MQNGGGINGNSRADNEYEYNDDDDANVVANKLGGVVGELAVTYAATNALTKEQKLLLATSVSADPAADPSPTIRV